MNLGTVLSYMGKVVSIVMPVIVGGILAAIYSCTYERN